MANTLRTTKRGGAYSDVAITTSKKFRATRRSGAYVDFQFATGKKVRVTRRDGTYIDLELVQLPVGNHIQNGWLYCPTCGDYRGGCSCGYLECGHGKNNTTCPYRIGQ